MVKLVTLLKRRPGLSMEEFVDYYETKHSKIGEKYLSPHAVRYVRRYFRPLPETIIPAACQTEQPYDLVMEIWFADQAALRAAFADLGTAAAQAEIVEDEGKLFDRSRIHFFLVEEHESPLRGGPEPCGGGQGFPGATAQKGKQGFAS
ncbi:MAG: EthD domain-containing protein [Proteobacteria bacterium]|nr:EthD domain-containing protein [Pseudomonadota bacterium]